MRLVDDPPRVSDDNVLRAVLSELRAIRQLLERQRPPSRLSRTDRAQLARLLPVVVAVYGSNPFTAREVLECDHAGLRLVRGTLTPRQLGRLLQRAEAQVADGYVVERVGTEVGATLWRVLVMTP